MADVGGATALHYAAQNGRVECARRLLQHGGAEQLVSADACGNTPLILAAWNGHAACVTELLRLRSASQVARANTKGPQNDRAEYVQDVVLLHHQPLDQIMAMDLHGNTALMLAAQHGHVECVYQLLQYEPSLQVGCRNKYGQNALIKAVQSIQVECTVQLLRHKPELQVRATDNNDGNTALISAAQDGHTACVRALLKHDPLAQVSAANKRGNTALIAAALYGNVGCVAELLQHTPATQVTATNSDGETALELAVLHLDSSSHAHTVRLLLAHRAPIPQKQHVWNLLCNVVCDMAQTIVAPDMLHQAIAHSVSCLPCSSTNVHAASVKQRARRAKDGLDVLKGEVYIAASR
eukprot:364189-Chlamydomonas_euryale.AAC.12